jgi:hypothetical protein
MRRTVILLALPVAWLACFSGGGSGGPAADASFDGSAAFDGSTPETSVDATEDTSPEAASAFDAPADVTPDAGPAPVVVTVVGALGLESGVPIVWGDSLGAWLTTGTTNAAGRASQLVTSGAVMTAILGPPSAPWLYTIMGVEPGDQLVVIDRGSVASLPGTQGNLDVNFASVPSPLPQGTSVLAFDVGPCSASLAAPPALLDLTSMGQTNCLGIGQFGATVGAAYPALVEANDDSSNVLGFAYARNNLLTTVDDAGNDDLAIGGSWSTSTTSQSLVVSAAEDAGVSASDFVATYGEAANGLLLPLPTRQPEDGGTLPPDTSLYTTHVGYADFVQTELGSYGGSQGAAMATRSPAPTASGSATIDATPLAALPVIGGLTVDSTVPAQPWFSWTLQSGSLASSTGILLEATWSGTDADGGPQSGTWTVVAPGTTKAALQVHAPVVPSQFAAWLPGAGSSFSPYELGMVALMGGTALPGYAQVRAASSLFNVQLQCLAWPLVPPLPAAGTLLLTAYTNVECG